MDNKPQTATTASFSALAWELARPHAGRLAFVLLLSVFATGLGLLQPWLTKLLIDGGILGRRMDVLLTVTAVLLLAAFLSAGLGALNRWLYVGVSARILFAFRGRVFAHLLTLSPRYFAAARTGELMSRMDGDVAEVQRFALDSALAVVSAAIMLTGSLIFMLALDARLTLIAFALLPLEILFLRAFRPLLMTRSAALRGRAADLSAFLVERISGVRLLQGLGAERKAAADFAAHQDRYRTDLLKQQMTSYGVGAGPGLMLTLSNAAVFVIGGSAVIDGSLTLGTLIAFSAYLGRATGPVQTFLGLYTAAARAEVSLDRVRVLLDAEPAVRSPAVPRALPDGPGGAIAIEGLMFGHPGRDAFILDQASAVIPAGSKVALEGLSGAGKSTLVDLLQRHYDPDGGRILLDGMDLRELDLAVLRRQMVVVTQDMILMRGSVAENLRLARPEASDDDLRAALLAAELGDLMTRLPQGLDSLIGERGASLSGGERQRFALARALLCDPRVLILDEATAGVDATAEARVLAAVDQLFAGRTRLIISHHPRAFRDVDLRLQLASGKLRVSA
ncbi:ABC transporter ATP-binding protein [Govanella unica]|uniref:ABC transporter ATP-binding protein/permease n=1 Tax=Govanella unica TaxID=2975056 RepID=A0A9X3TUZ2_9PROT|nr:ABC transporter ATP-binding protein [Govania unica]MDA5192590.1 ABC transporter ATP-binding protein/permease [Govania unica]